MNTYITKTEADTILEALKSLDPFGTRVKEVRNVTRKMNYVLEYFERVAPVIKDPVTDEISWEI